MEDHDDEVSANARYEFALFELSQSFCSVFPVSRAMLDALCNITVRVFNTLFSLPLTRVGVNTIHRREPSPRLSFVVVCTMTIVYQFSGTYPSQGEGPDFPLRFVVRSCWLVILCLFALLCGATTDGGVGRSFEAWR